MPSPGAPTPSSHCVNFHGVPPSDPDAASIARQSARSSAGSTLGGGGGASASAPPPPSVTHVPNPNSRSRSLRAFACCTAAALLRPSASSWFTTTFPPFTVLAVDGPGSDDGPPPPPPPPPYLGGDALLHPTLASARSLSSPIWESGYPSGSVSSSNAGSSTAPRGRLFVGRANAREALVVVVVVVVVVVGSIEFSFRAAVACF